LGAPKRVFRQDPRQALRSDAKPLSPMACALAVLPVADVRLAKKSGQVLFGFFFWVNLGWIPSGKPGKRLHNYGKIHHFEWENPLFLWQFCQ